MYMRCPPLRETTVRKQESVYRVVTVGTDLRHHPSLARKPYSYRSSIPEVALDGRWL